MKYDLPDPFEMKAGVLYMAGVIDGEPVVREANDADRRELGWPYQRHDTDRLLVMPTNDCTITHLHAQQDDTEPSTRYLEIRGEPARVDALDSLLDIARDAIDALFSEECTTESQFGIGRADENYQKGSEELRRRLRALGYPADPRWD
jgi:hypothetical protein